MLPTNDSAVKPNSALSQQISGAPLQVVIFPHGQNTAGLYPDQSPPRACPVVTLEAAMLQPYDTDVHIQALEANVLLPYRVTKAALAAPGALWRKTHMNLDFDPPKSILVNGKAPEAWHTMMREKLAKLKEDHPGALVYRTWKGYQVCWLLPEPIELTAASYRAVHTYNHSVGLHVERVYGLVYDRAATSPLHLFRVPRALRSAEKDYRSFLPLHGATLGVATVAPSVEDGVGAQQIMEKGGSKITKDQDLRGSQRNLPLIDHVVGSQTPPPAELGRVGSLRISWRETTSAPSPTSPHGGPTAAITSSARTTRCTPRTRMARRARRSSEGHSTPAMKAPVTLLGSCVRSALSITAAATGGPTLSSRSRATPSSPQPTSCSAMAGRPCTSSRAPPAPARRRRCRVPSQRSRLSSSRGTSR